MNKNNFIVTLKKVFLPIILEIAIIFGGLVLDLASKAIVQNTMDVGQTVVLIPKFLNFYYTKNTKAAFGSDFGLGKLFGETGVLVFFIILTLVAVGFFCFLLFKRPQKGILFRIAFSLIIAGAIGNMIDRIFFGYVRDFIQIEYFGLTIFGSKTFAVFNIADSCVVVGAILLIVYFLFFDKTLRGEKNSDTTETLPETSTREAENPSDDMGQTDNASTDGAELPSDSTEKTDNASTDETEIPSADMEKADSISSDGAEIPSADMKQTDNSSSEEKSPSEVDETDRDA